MYERKLINGDIALVGGSVARISDYADSVLQTVKCFLSTFQGECFTDYDAGVPWFDEILGADVLFSDYAIQVVKEKVLSVPGVRSVDKAELSIDGRKISGKISLTLENGERTEMEL